MSKTNKYDKYESGKLRPFVPQHNFHLEKPGKALTRAVQGSPVLGGNVPFSVPKNSIKTCK